MSLRMKVYNLLVNRNPAIRRRYQSRAVKARGGGKLGAWLYLLWLNVLCLFGGGKRLEENSHVWEEKDLPLEESESARFQMPPVEEFVRRLLSYDVISFDIFDTLIFRPFSSPADLFFLVGERLDYPDFQRIRCQLEGAARREAFEKRGSYEVTLDEIYAVMERETGIPRREGQETEFRTEKELCRPNPYMLQVYRRLLEAGKRVILLSDMYLEKDRIGTLLALCGYEGYEALYLSNDRGKGKFDGALYRLAGEELGKDLKYIQIGDNMESDVRQARRAGWESIHYPNVQAMGESFRAGKMSPLVGGAYRGIVNAHLHCGLKVYSREYEYGFVYGGLLILGYCHFIHEYAQAHQIDKILFLARDGDILKQVYDRLYPGENTEYVYWSRLAAAKMTARYYKYDYLRRFLVHKINQKIPLEQIFASMELTDMLPLLLKERKELTAQSCLTDRNLEQVKAFFLAHWQETTEHYREQIVAGGEYFARILRGCERACAVDVGWAGSGAMALRCLIEKEWHIPCRLTGLLAGTNTVHNAEPDTGEAQLASGALASYLFSSSSNRDLWEYHDLNRGDNLYLELLMSSPHPSFKGFGRGEKGEVTYLFGEPEKNQEGVRQIQKGVLDFASLYSQAFEKYPYLLNISGRDAYAPLAAAGGKRQAYLKKVYEAFELKVGI